MNRNGSCNLILTIISAAILLYYINAFHSVNFMQDIAIKKYKYEKHYRSTQALYNYGLTACINNFEIFTNQAKKNIKIINFYNNFWPLDEKEFFGDLRLLIQDAEIIIESKVLDTQSKDIFIIKALLIMHEKKIKVSNWSLNVL